MLDKIQSYANLCKAQMHSRNSKLFNVQYCVKCNCMPSAETMQSTKLCSVLNYAECRVLNDTLVKSQTGMEWVAGGPTQIIGPKKPI